MMEKDKHDEELKIDDIGSDFARGLMAVAQTLTEGRGAAGFNPFSHGFSDIEITATVERQKISFSLRITGAAAGAPDSPSAAAFVVREQVSIASDILSYCVSLDSSDDAVMTDCNAFVRKVAANFGVSIDSDLDADGIVVSFERAPFTKQTTDPATAMSWASDGLVVAGMTRAMLSNYGPHTHGHVAIVHNSPDPAHPGFPMASWGSLGGRGKSNFSIRQSFPAAACDARAVQFAFAPIN